jgi:hypothetical protein
VAALAVLLVGCGLTGGPAATPSPSPASSGLPSEDPELEALLPDQIGGEATEKLSLRGPELVGAGSSDPTFADFVERLAADPDDVAVAYAYTLESEVQVFAYQIRGTEPEPLLDALQAAIGAQEATAGVTWTPAVLADRPVRMGTPVDPGNARIYLHGIPDIGFIIVTDDPALAAEVAGGLP